jgi:hypothetical protein
MIVGSYIAVTKVLVPIIGGTYLVCNAKAITGIFMQSCIVPGGYCTITLKNIYLGSLQAGGRSAILLSLGEQPKSWPGTTSS